MQRESPRRTAFAVYSEPRMLAVLFMGFASGLPLPLTSGTLSFRLAEAGVSLAAIGLFALIGLSYNLKFVWSPVMDRGRIPWLTARLGRRRSWALATQLLLAAAIAALALADPKVDPWGLALAAVFVAFLSASQDIVIDAFRIELLKPEEQGAGAAATQWGYRFGMMAGSAGALYLAEYGGWEIAYLAMAGLMAVGMATVLLTREPLSAAPASGGGLGAWLKTAVVAPFAEFIARPHWLAILAFVVFYKFGDALAGVMANPFYVAMGFTKIEVANVSKIFGVAATLLGLIAGGAAVFRWGALRSLLACGFAQMLSNLMYVAQATAGHDVGLLFATIGIENFAGGMGSAAFVAYISSLCNVAFTATQYALLSSLAAVGRTTLAASGGWLAERLDWIPFFLASTAAAIPGLLLLWWLMRRLPR